MMLVYNDDDDDDGEDDNVNQVKQWCYCSMAVPQCKRYYCSRAVPQFKNGTIAVLLSPNVKKVLFQCNGPKIQNGTIAVWGPQ